MIFAEALKKSLNEEKIEDITNRENERERNKGNTINKLSRSGRRITRKEEQVQRTALRIVSWFLDSEINSNESPYSIQNLCSFLYQKFDLKPGTWFKPSSVLSALQSIHKKSSQFTVPNLQIDVYLEGTIYVSQALKKVTGQNVNRASSILDLENMFEIVEEERDDINTSLHVSKSSNSRCDKENPESQCTDIDGANLKGDDNDIEHLLNKKWHSSLVLFVMTKIGLDKPNPEYMPFIKELLSYPESIGMIGKDL